MFKNMSIRVRVTVITVLLLSMSCLGLTLVLNKSAYKMMNITETLPSITEYDMNSQRGYNPYSIQQELLGYRLYRTTKEIIESEVISAPKIIQSAQLINSYKISSIEYMVCFILFGGALMYFIIYKSLKPLTDLSNHIKDKSVDNLYINVPITESKDEIYDLTTSFNEMTNKLNEAFNMQKRFSNNAAHELRTPLTVMRTNLDVFKKRGNHTNEEYEELIESMRSQITRLSDLVSNLLDFTNMEDIDLSQEINLKTLITFVSKDLYFIAEKKNIQINVEGEDVLIKGNEELIYQAFYNLVENSIKYNNQNGEVYIYIKKSNKEAIVEIKDTGIGIHDDMKKKVFEPFFTVDKSRSRKLGGAGIGLSIVKSIIDKHKGVITIKDNVNIGTIFEVKFLK